MSTIRERTTWPLKGLQGIRGSIRATRTLLVCGAASSILYATMLVVVPMKFPGYSSAQHTVSELSAIGAPSRPLWSSMALVWGVLYAGFGCGVWRVAGENRRLRTSGGLIVAAAVLGLFWPPMHQREVLAAGGGSLTDTLHLAWTAANGVLTLLAMGFAAGALGSHFRQYTIATMLILLGAGLLTSLAAPGVSADLPTPWIGVWERANIGAWLLWVVVLALVLLRRTPSRPVVPPPHDR